jgi:hypothetical protein
MYSPSWGTFAPRIGFAYAVSGDGKTSLRGGFGISYERDFANISYNASFSPPATAVLTSTCQAYISTCNTFITNSNLVLLGHKIGSIRWAYPEKL